MTGGNDAPYKPFGRDLRKEGLDLWNIVVLRTFEPEESVGLLTPWHGRGHGLLLYWFLGSLSDFLCLWHKLSCFWIHDTSPASALGHEFLAQFNQGLGWVGSFIWAGLGYSGFFGLDSTQNP